MHGEQNIKILTEVAEELAAVVKMETASSSEIWVTTYKTETGHISDHLNLILAVPLRCLSYG